MPTFSSPLLWLAIVTFLLVIAFAVWNLTAVKRQQKYGQPKSGIGGPNDPIA